MSNLVCRNCKSISVEYEDYCGGTSYYHCKTCGQRGDKDKFTQQSLFDRITQSPEVLAEKSVYAHECCRIPDGATSPFIDDIFWFDDEKGDTWDERFDSAWEKAIAATLAELKEVEK